MSSGPWGSDSAKEGGQAEIPYSVEIESAPRKERRGISKKVVAVIVVAIILGSAGLFVWFEYLRHWSIKDVIEEVINDPFVGTPGFSHNLAGRTVVVDGEVTNITTHQTTRGPLSLIELDDIDEMHLVAWGEVSYEVGKRISMGVKFEWSVCNNETHVYSPQLDFPVFAYLPSIEVVLRAVAATAGVVLTISTADNGSIVAKVFDQFPVLPLAGLNCSLRVGHSSFAAEYVDVMGIGTPNHAYGHELDSIIDLATGAGRNGTLYFSDSDHDGNLSRNDTFVLRNLSRPAQDSGAFTYALVIEPNPFEHYNGDVFPVSYMVMTSKGLLRIEDRLSSYVRLGNEVVSSSEVRFTFASVLDPISWDHATFMLTDGMNMDCSYWRPAAGDLDNGPMSREYLPSVTLNSLQANCEVVDVAGNGLVNEGDYFVISTWGGTCFSPDLNYTVAVMYEPTMSQMAQSTFHG